MHLNKKNTLQNFIGNSEASDRLIHSLNKSNFTGAWLLRGPKGIGKAKLAESIIRELLKIYNQSFLHPDLFVLRKDEEEKKFIAVDEVRKVSLFLSKSSIKGDNKCVFIDSLSEMNVFGHNSLLKVLEDFSINTSFFIIDHMNTYIPSTITSRCKKINFKKLNIDEIKKLLSKSTVDENNYNAYSILANGSFGNIFEFEENNALNIHEVLCDYLLTQNSDITLLKKLFLKKNNNKVFLIIFYILTRILTNVLKYINSIEINYINQLEEKLINYLSRKFNHDEIIYFLNVLYDRKKNVINLNLDAFTATYITLLEIKKIEEKDEK